MGKQVSHLIIGNGIAGITATEILSAAGEQNTITMVADDPSPVYYRPALKDFLGGHITKEKLWARPNTFYQKHGVRFVPGRVATIFPGHHYLQLQDGEQIAYDKLLLANGARPLQLNCPGTDLAGVSTLRTIVDYQETLRRLPQTARVVICGSGTLALESAETLRQRGYQVTHLLRKQTLWSAILDRTASDMVLQEERRVGIDVRTGETIREIIGKRGQVTHVITSTGARIPCDLLLIAIGIAPNIDFIQKSGIVCQRGVQVDAAMHTNAPDIYAAGDVIETTDAITGQTRVLGQWFPAIQQARTAAYSMLDQLTDSDAGTFFNATFLCGLDFVSLGVTPQQGDTRTYQEIIAEPAPRSYRKVLLKNGVPIGALFLGEREQALAFKRAIDAHVDLTPVLNRLFNKDFHLMEWLDQQQVPEAIFDIQMRVETQTAVSHAYLVPIPHPQVVVATRETPLGLQPQGDLIGRQKDITLSIDHRSVSRIHAEIRAINGQYLLLDRGSSNGTYINTLPLLPDKTHVLQQNDQIRFGDVQFCFQLRPQSLNTDNQSCANKPANLFGHLLGSQLENNTVRSIPPAALAATGNKPALILVTKNVEPRIVPVDSHQLLSRRLSVGRDEDNAIVLHDGAASRKHAELFEAADGLYIHDLNSSNGVFVNKVRISNPYHLLHGDRIVIGNTLIYYSLPQVAEQPVQSVPPTRASIKTPVPMAATNKQPVVGLMHRNDIVPLSEKQTQFEINMCIGCDRCMAACPLPSSTQVHIADLNQATISAEIVPHVARFTQECIMCGSCVPVCPVANHRDLLMLSLKQRLGTPWDSNIEIDRVLSALPDDWSVAQLITYLREQPILSDAQLVPERYLLHLFASSHMLTFEAGATIIREGEYGRDLYFLLEGSLSVLTMQAKHKELQVAIINPGEYIGEYGMLTGQPYPTTVRALTSAQVLQIPEQVMQHLMELVPQTRRFFEQFNNAHSIESILKRMALFQGVSADDIHTLATQSQVQLYDRDECLFTEDDQHTSKYKGHPARETLHILLEGFVKVTRVTAEGTGHDKTNERVIAYRQNGDYFAGGLDLMGDGRAVTVNAITRTRVAEIPRETLLGLFAYYPEVDQRFSVRLREYIASTASSQTGVFKIAHLNLQRPSQPADVNVRAGLHSLVSSGVVEGTEVLLIDLDKCIHCNECEDACARRHGHSRMNRKGMIVGNISVATACRQCQDPVCMLCSRAGIARRPDGEVYITESCIGCGICAERCPYGAISIVDLDEKTVATPSKKRSHTVTAKLTDKRSARKFLPMANGTTMLDRHISSGPLDFASAPHGYDEMRKKVAIKCDLCVGYNNQACVQACPTGAAIRVQPTKFFGSTEEILRRRTH